MTHPTRMYTTDGWVDLGVQRAMTKADLDPIAFRGYAFRMVSGEAGVGPGSFIRAAQQNNNVYEDPDYFQGWRAGNATGIKVMKAGLVRVYATVYMSGLTASVTAEASAFLNGVAHTATRTIPTGTFESFVIGPVIRNCVINDLWQFGAVSPAGALAYQGTDGRFTHGFFEYLGP